MNERLRKLMMLSGYAEPEMAGRAKMLADLIIAECVDAVMEGDRHRRDYFADKIHQHWGWDQFDPRQHAMRVAAKEHAKDLNNSLRTYDAWKEEK